MNNLKFAKSGQIGPIGPTSQTAPIIQIDKVVQTAKPKVDFYHQFKPFDTIIKRLVRTLKPSTYKSDKIGFFTLVSYALAVYFIYQQKEFLTWIFVFIGSFITFFDCLDQNTNLSPKQKYKEMIHVIIKLFSHLIFFILLKTSLLTNNQTRSNTIYMLISMLLIIIILNHHTETKLSEIKIRSRKLGFVRDMCVLMLLVLAGFVVYEQKSKINNKKKHNSMLDLFILNEEK